ncbi:MAG: O-acetylhomoserine aminocarboxypropyltransferase/cysteine synthase family protein [Candidatus Margulisiibacteriota bacterium]
MKFETKAIHSGHHRDPRTGATAISISQSATFAYDTAEELADVFAGKKFGYVYSRIANPTVAAFEQRVTELENGVGGIGFASGMAAINATVLTLASAGDELIASPNLFGGTLLLFKSVLAKCGITVVFVDPIDLKAVEAAITPKTRGVFIETIANPSLRLPNIKALAELCHAHHLPLVVDSTVTTPYLFPAKELGVDVVIHCATKYISGSGTISGGVVVDLGLFDWKTCKTPAIAERAKQFGKMAFLATARKDVVIHIGAALAPAHAQALMVGFESLALRMERHCDNALALAQFLATHPAVTAVNYPGLPDHPDFGLLASHVRGKGGGLLTFRLKDKAAAFACINGLKLASNAANLGDAKTLVIHAASTIYKDFTAEQMAEAGVDDTLIRVSVGIEHIDDIIADFQTALGA